MHLCLKNVTFKYESTSFQLIIFQKVSKRQVRLHLKYVTDCIRYVTEIIKIMVIYTLISRELLQRAIS